MSDQQPHRTRPRYVRVDHSVRPSMTHYLTRPLHVLMRVCFLITVPLSPMSPLSCAPVNVSDPDGTGGQGLSVVQSLLGPYRVGQDGGMAGGGSTSLSSRDASPSTGNRPYNSLGNAEAGGPPSDSSTVPLVTMDDATYSARVSALWSGLSSGQGYVLSGVGSGGLADGVVGGDTIDSVASSGGVGTTGVTSGVGTKVGSNDENKGEVSPVQVEGWVSIDPMLQAALSNYLSQVKAGRSGVVVTKISTGEVLAASEGSAAVGWSGVGHSVVNASLPAASLFKIVTSAAALTYGLKGVRSGDDMAIAVPGGCGSYDQPYRAGVGRHVRPRKVRGMYDVDEEGLRSKDDQLVVSSRGVPTISMTQAFERSCNGYFGELARALPAGSVLSMARRLGWGGGMRVADFLLDPSSIFVPYGSEGDDSWLHGLARMGAGFGQVSISAVHGAWLAGAIGRGGEARQVSFRKGGSQTPPTRVLDAGVSQKILSMMAAAAEDGTMREVTFSDRYAAVLGHRFGGKTGTLATPDRTGLLTWVVALYPIQNPQIAISAFSITQNAVAGVDRSSRGKYIGAEAAYLWATMNNHELGPSSQNVATGVSPGGLPLTTH